MITTTEKEVVKFDKTEAELKAIVKQTAGIIKVDITNKEELAKVKRARLTLGSLRTGLKKFGKDKRDYFNNMSKTIIDKEKKLVKIVEDEENRLKEFEDEAKELQIKAERLVVLPTRKEELVKIGDKTKVTNEFICSMDAEEFKGYCNQRIAEKNEADRLALEKQKEKQEKEKERLEWEKGAQEREEKARKEERDRIAIEEKEKKERIAIEEKEEKERVATEEKEEKERIANEERIETERIAEEKRKMAADKKYQKWLTDNGYSEKTKTDFLLHDDIDNVTLYKLVGVYEK